MSRRPHSRFLPFVGSKPDHTQGFGHPDKATETVLLGFTLEETSNGGLRARITHAWGFDDNGKKVRVCEVPSWVENLSCLEAQVGAQLMEKERLQIDDEPGCLFDRIAA